MQPLLMSRVGFAGRNFFEYSSDSERKTVSGKTFVESGAS